MYLIFLRIVILIMGWNWKLYILRLKVLVGLYCLVMMSLVAFSVVSTLAVINLHNRLVDFFFAFNELYDQMRKFL